MIECIKLLHCGVICFFATVWKRKVEKEGRKVERKCDCPFQIAVRLKDFQVILLSETNKLIFSCLFMILHTCNYVADVKLMMNLAQLSPQKKRQFCD